MTFQVGKQDTDYKKIFGIFAALMTVFGTLGFTALIIQGFYGIQTPIYYNLVWITVGCMLGGLTMLRIYLWSKK